MKTLPYCLLTGTSLLLALLPACQPPGLNKDGSPRFVEQERALIFSLSPLADAPANPSNRQAENPQAAHLGQYLFYEPRLSVNGQLSCASCHNPGLGWSDARPVAVGLKTGTRNSPSLWNVAQQRWFFWDGRSDSLWSQAIQPLESPLEMGHSRAQVYALFQREPDLKAGYEAVFGPLPPGSPAGMDRFISNVGKALEAFQRRIRSGESPFDRFAQALRQQDLPAADAALSVEAQKGLRLFIGRGQCILCHSGPHFSDGEFHNLGLPKRPGQPGDPGRFAGIAALKRDPLNALGAYSDLPSDDTWADKLRYVVQQPDNQGEFKTPSLREVAQTGPYMHDGRFESLEQVIAFYSTVGSEPAALGRREDTLQPLNLDAGEIAQLAAFLRSLSSGPPDAELTRQPEKAVLH